MADRDDLITELRSTNAALLQRITELELQLAKALKNSSNSSKSPSSDIVQPPKKQAKRRKKAKRGGQKGHERKLREPLPLERVDEIIDYEIDDDEVERLKLTLTGEFETIQHIELPDVPVIVTEHRFPLYASPEGDLYYPYAPEIHCQPIFGPRLLATIGWMKSQAHSSYTTLEKYCDDVLGFSVSRGYLSKLCNGVISDSLPSAHEELKLAIPEQHQLGSDETSLKNNGKKHWIWCITAPLFTLFQIASSRSRSVLEELVGADFKGFIHFDYFSANCSFAWNYSMKAQYCWAHLIRDMRFLLKHPDKKTKAWAEQLLDRSKKMFSAWHGHTRNVGRRGDDRSRISAFDAHASRLFSGNRPQTARFDRGRKSCCAVHRDSVSSRRFKRSRVVRDVPGLFPVYVRVWRGANEQSQRTADSPLCDRSKDHPRHSQRTWPALSRADVDCHCHLWQAGPQLLPRFARIDRS